MNVSIWNSLFTCPNSLHNHSYVHPIDAIKLKKLYEKQWAGHTTQPGLWLEEIDLPRDSLSHVYLYPLSETDSHELYSSCTCSHLLAETICYLPVVWCYHGWFLLHRSGSSHVIWVHVTEVLKGQPAIKLRFVHFHWELWTPLSQRWVLGYLKDRQFHIWDVSLGFYRQYCLR